MDRICSSGLIAGFGGRRRSARQTRRTGETEFREVSAASAMKPVTFIGPRSAGLSRTGRRKDVDDSQPHCRCDLSASREPGANEQMPPELALELRERLVAHAGPLRCLAILVSPIGVDVPGKDVRLARLEHVEAVQEFADAAISVGISDRTPGLRFRIPRDQLIDAAQVPRTF